jgi:hypothetical protein
MAFRKVESIEKKFHGFFDYIDGNVIEGIVKHVSINGKTDNGADKGYVGIELTVGCKAKVDDVEFDAEPGQCIALSITSATRILIGTEGKLVRCTFNGFKQTAKGRFHDWTVEIDDGMGKAAE